MVNANIVSIDAYELNSTKNARNLHTNDPNLYG